MTGGNGMEGERGALSKSFPIQQLLLPSPCNQKVHVHRGN